MFKAFQVTVPATSANIGPGFDVWGMALDIYNVFECYPSKQYEFLAKNSPTLDMDVKNNLFFKSYQKVFQKNLKKPIPISIKANIAVPIARGLGSSATAIIGGMMAAVEILKQKFHINFTLKQVYELACVMEKHPDNIGAAIFGGLILNVDNLPVSLDFKAPIQLACLVPNIKLSTKTAREIIPPKVPLSTLTYHTSHIACLVHLFQKKKWNAIDKLLLEKAIGEKIHQQARSKFIKGMNATFVYWLKLGALGCYLSGSGSTLISFWSKKTDLKKLNLSKIIKEQKIETQTLFPKVSKKGVHIQYV